jgi:hypothetical protein
MHNIPDWAILIFIPWLIINSNPFILVTIFYGFFISLLFNIYLLFRKKK